MKLEEIETKFRIRLENGIVLKRDFSPGPYGPSMRLYYVDSKGERVYLPLRERLIKD